MIEGPMFTPDQRDLMTRIELVAVREAIYLVLFSIALILCAIEWQSSQTAATLAIAAAFTGFFQAASTERQRRRMERVFKELPGPLERGLSDLT